MSRYLGLILLASLFLSGCGDIEWFPDNYGTNTGNSTSSPVLTKAYNPATILAGTDSSLTFTITNGTAAPAQSGLGFTDQLSTTLAVSANSSQCGGTVSASGSTITFTGGLLATGVTSCTITATILAAPAGSYVNKKTDVTGFAGGLVNSVTDQTLTVTPAQTATTGNVTASFVAEAFAQDSINKSYGILIDAYNTGTAAASVTFKIIAIDSSFADIPSSEATFTFDVPAGTTVDNPEQPAGTSVDVPLADAAKIKYWRIISLTIN